MTLNMASWGCSYMTLYAWIILWHHEELDRNIDEECMKPILAKWFCLMVPHILVDTLPDSCPQSSPLSSP